MFTKSEPVAGTVNGKLETGNWKLKIGNCKLEIIKVPAQSVFVFPLLY
jgi:hypothetical protein